MMNKKVLLMILDGWGIGDGSKSDVISNVPTPNIDHLLKTYPNSRLFASGENVGLPDGQMGNSEVGHLNIGAGRIVYQDLVQMHLPMPGIMISRYISWDCFQTVVSILWISICIICVI
jgi:2,3-bisphosphoglycerate-independent phosphoglycerate mutase